MAVDNLMQFCRKDVSMQNRCCIHRAVGSLDVLAGNFVETTKNLLRIDGSGRLELLLGESNPGSYRKKHLGGFEIFFAFRVWSWAPCALTNELWWLVRRSGSV